eukprot:TRINITY_DN769_c0_g1_i2.p1 TRINITY_DN769_c0_g1~~TRINITY_DN769_c0_g1_i2.p1  ORF type:complete len:123 (-),score=24.76 TRINITY_DN769_c0_g1_i2:101-469(-)
MCIRDRVSTQSTGSVTKKSMAEEPHYHKEELTAEEEATLDLSFPELSEDAGFEICELKVPIERECHKSSCVKPFWFAYKSCEKRISKLDPTEWPNANCAPQYIEYWKCIDTCAAKPLWEKLK